MFHVSWYQYLELAVNIVVPLQVVHYTATSYRMFQIQVLGLLYIILIVLSPLSLIERDQVDYYTGAYGKSTGLLLQNLECVYRKFLLRNNTCTGINLDTRPIIYHTVDFCFVKYIMSKKQDLTLTIVTIVLLLVKQSEFVSLSRPRLLVHFLELF